MERKFVYQDGSGMRRTLVWDEAEPDKFGVFAEADMTNLARLNREQGAYESARHATTTVARIPFTWWEKSYHENWTDEQWRRFLNDEEFRDFRVWRGRV